MCLARIRAYDRQGPSLHAVIASTPRRWRRRARSTRSARRKAAIAAPRHSGRAQGQLRHLRHADDGGSVLLEGSIPPDDAFVVKKLRDAGAIILAKVNMSEFASGGATARWAGRSLNPHDLRASPSGSSGGTGVAIAAAYAPIGVGTDTGGSIRGPATANGIVGAEADARAAQPRRHHPARAQLRHRRADGAKRLRRGGRARRDDRHRPRRRRDRRRAKGSFETDYTKYLKPTR